MDQKEYNQIMGISTEDIGSRKKLLKKSLEYAENKGYKKTGFYKLKKNQLKAIFHKI